MSVRKNLLLDFFCDAFIDVNLEYPDLTVHLTLFNATISEGVPHKLEHNNIKWITSSEIPNRDFCLTHDNLKTLLGGQKMANQKMKKIIELIENGVEGDTVDFKQQYYHDAQKSDFIKDVISFANASSLEDKYIIFGVSDDTREIIGVSDNEIPDISDINQLIRTYCDPFIEIDVESVNIGSKKVAAIIVKKIKT